MLYIMEHVMDKLEKIGPEESISVESQSPAGVKSTESAANELHAITVCLKLQRS